MHWAKLDCCCHSSIIICVEIHNIALFIMKLSLQTKKDLSSQGYEAVTDDVVAQIYIDEKAVQLFLWADTEDRAANFNKYVFVHYYNTFE